MQVIKEMHERLGNEEREIENMEARVNASLRDINIRRGNLQLRRMELGNLERFIQAARSGADVHAGPAAAGNGLREVLTDAQLRRTYDPSYSEAKSIINKSLL